MLAIDPGNVESAYVVYDRRRRKFGAFGKVPNERLLSLIYHVKPDFIVCEEICSYGMAVGKTTFDTVRFTGRIQQLSLSEGIPFRLIPRYKVKASLAPLPRKNDRDVRAAMLKLYGEQGTKAAPGPTYGMSKDMWAALAVAHAFSTYHPFK